MGYSGGCAKPILYTFSGFAAPMNNVQEFCVGEIATASVLRGASRSS
jgi:hypothetical protein